MSSEAIALAEKKLDMTLGMCFTSPPHIYNLLFSGIIFDFLLFVALNCR